MLTLILRNLPGIAAGAALAASLMLVWSTAYVEPRAYRAGLEAGRAAALERSMDIIKERGRNDAQIRSMSDSALCIELGGVFTNGQCS